MDPLDFGDGKDHFFNPSLSGTSSQPSAVNGNLGMSKSTYKSTDSSGGGFDLNADDFLSNYDYPKKQSYSDALHVKQARPSSSSPENYMSGNHVDKFSESKSARNFSGDLFMNDDKHYKEIIATVEHTMKKYADNLLKVLEGMSSRLTQLELINQRLERSLGNIRDDMVDNHKEEDKKFNFLENHIREVYRAVQILRDKQEIADAHTELVKLQLAKKESFSNLHGSEEKTQHPASSASDGKHEHAFQSQNSQSQNRQLLPALPAPPAPQQMPSANIPVPAPDPCQPLPQQQPSSPAAASQQQTGQIQPPTNSMPMQPYYQPPPQPQSQPQQQGPIHHQISQPPPHVAQMPHIQQSPQPQLPSPAQAQGPQLPSYLQNLPNQSVPRPPHLSQQTPQMQVQPNQLRSNIYGVVPEGYSYASEASNQQIQIPYPPSSMPSDFNSYANTASHPSPVSQGSLSMQAPPRPQLSQGLSESGIAPSQPQMPPTHPMHGYPNFNLPPKPQPNNYGPPLQPGSQMNPFQGTYMRYPPPQSQQYMHSGGTNMPAPGRGGFEDVVEQVASMGFSREEVRAVIQRLAESGQPIDLNVVLDRLNNGAAGAGPSQRGWYN